MSALIIPQEVSAECAKKLFSLAAAANRDAMTLVKQAMALARDREPARPLGVLKKYVGKHNQYGSAEVGEIIASIETAADPEALKRMAYYQARRDAAKAKQNERRKVALSAASALMRKQEAGRELIDAVLAFHEDSGSLWDVEHYLPDKVAEREVWAAENQERLRAKRMVRIEAVTRTVLAAMGQGKPPHHENGNVVYLHGDDEGCPPSVP